MRPVLIYSVLRLGLFGLAFVGMLALGARGVLAALLAAIVSLGLSFVLLRTQRDQVALAVVERRARRGGRTGRVLDDDSAAEDAALDAAESDAASAETGRTQERGSTGTSSGTTGGTP